MRLARPIVVCSALAACAMCVLGCPPEEPPEEPMVVCSNLREMTGTWRSTNTDVHLTMELEADGGMEGDGTGVPCCSTRLVADWEVCATMPRFEGTLNLLVRFDGHPCCASGVVDPPELREVFYQFADADTIVVTGLFDYIDEPMLFERVMPPSI